MAVTTFASSVFPEKGCRTARVAFIDEDGNPVDPNSVSWSLYDRPMDPTEDPTTVNSRSSVSATADVDDNSDGTYTLDIVLEGNDLAFLSGESGTTADRALVVDYQYNSDIGSNLDDCVQYFFTIERVFGKT